MNAWKYTFMACTGITLSLTSCKQLLSLNANLPASQQFWFIRLFKQQTNFSLKQCTLLALFDPLRSLDTSNGTASHPITFASSAASLKEPQISPCSIVIAWVQTLLDTYVSTAAIMFNTAPLCCWQWMLCHTCLVRREVTDGNWLAWWRRRRRVA